MKDKYNIKLVANQELTDEEAIMIMQFMQNEDGIKEIFGTKISRFYTANVYALIKKDDIPIGFFLAVSEHTQGLLFIDMGIKEKHRGKGYGKQVIQEFLSRYRGDEFILGETKANNALANGSVSELGELIHQRGDINYYLLNKSKEEFFTSPAYQEFLKHISPKESDRRTLKRNK